MKITATTVATFTVQPATGPNPNKLGLEIIDSDGDRVAYASSVRHAKEIIRECVEAEGFMPAICTVEVDHE